MNLFSLRLATLPGITLEGVFTHLASSEIPQSDYTDYQLGDFPRRPFSFSANWALNTATPHSANSASIQRFPDSHMDIVRPGIMLYGSGGMGEVDLRPVMKLKTRIVQLRKVPTGTPVGYGGSFVTGRGNTGRDPSDRVCGRLPESSFKQGEGFPRRKACSAYRVCLHGFYHG